MNKVIYGILALVGVSGIVILVLAFGPGSIQIPPSAPAQAQAPAVSPEAAVFQVDSLYISPTRVYPGQEVVVMATVTNKGDIEGEYVAELKINNAIEEQKKVTLPAGATKTLNFSTSIEEAGTYTVILGGLTSQFEILTEATPAQSGAGSTASSCCGSNGSSTPATPETPTRPTTRRGCCGG